MTTKIYGIRNCSTMKKAFAWLDEHGVAYDFHDYKKAGVEREHLETWCREAGWEKVITRAGITFRQLPETDKVGLDARPVQSRVRAGAADRGRTRDRLQAGGLRGAVRRVRGATGFN